MFRIAMRVATGGAFIIAILLRPHTAFSQEHHSLDSLVARALLVHPQLRALEAQRNAARSRIGPAGAWSDPMLMAGLQNYPLSRQQAGGHGASAGPEPMTMKMVGVTQTIPYPGKTSLRTSIARADAEVADARLAAETREIKREVHHAYFDVIAARMLRALVERQQQVANSIPPATEARYVSGSAAQADVLKARTESALLVQERNAATQEERASLAHLNALLDQQENVSVADSFPAEMPAGTPLSLDSVQAIALRSSPRLQERRASIAARTAEAQLAVRAYLPDVDVTVQYGQRDRLPDMITGMISVPVPVHRGRKQSAEARAARFDVAAAEAELRAEENAVRADVARSYAAVERHRADIALLDRAILPQARATFASASTTYQSGRGELLGVLDAMRALFATETMYVRSLAEYAKAQAELEALAGVEVVR